MEFQCVTCTAAFASMSALGRHYQDAHRQGKPVGHGRQEMGGASFADNAAAEHERPNFAAASLGDLARREDTSVARRTPAPPQCVVSGMSNPIHYGGIQDGYAAHIAKVEALFDPEWWMMFESVRTESQATQERVLRASKACAAPAPTLDGFYSPPKPYPTNRAAFRKVSAAGAPDLVREAVLMQGTVDLSSVGLPDITFEYIDPVWVWVQQAAAVGKHYKLWFEAVTDWNDSGERMYGRGVETGDAMRQALKKCGPFELPALLGLHFDKAKLGAR